MREEEKKIIAQALKTEKDAELGRKEYMSNQTKTYIFKNRGLELKMQAMEILAKNLKDLDVLASSQCGKEKLDTLAVMAQIGRAIIPD